MIKTIDRELKRGELIKMIREMDIGDVMKFPLTKYDSVCNVAYNRLHIERSEGHRWTVNADIANKSTVITKVS